MKILPDFKKYKKVYHKLLLITVVLLIIVLIAMVFYINNKINIKKGQDHEKIYRLILEIEISLLQCRRAEKNFLIRHDKANADSFTRWAGALKKHLAKIHSALEHKAKNKEKDRAVLRVLNNINGEIVIYENAFQDIRGLYDTAVFGPVHDEALVKITDEVTLMAEPISTPSSVNTTGSLIEAARNLEYYINLSPQSSMPIIFMLKARRWEKNFQTRYDTLTGCEDSRSFFYVEKIKQEISKIRGWMESNKMIDRPEQRFVKLKSTLRSALNRYEVNFAQLSYNIDAFNIKKKVMLKAVQNLDLYIQILKEKVQNMAATETKTEIEKETEIGSIYYLSPKMPIHNQEKGNDHDVGSLVLNKPLSYGYRHCKNWVQFYFDSDGLYARENLISQVYLHIWIRTVDNTIDVGYEKNGMYSGGSGGMDDYISINHDTSKGYYINNGCSLITCKINMDCLFKGEEIYRFAIKFSQHSGFPSVVMAPQQYSFIIINPPDDSILKSTDSDRDGLNDYEEMFVYYTNPYDEDTDGDGFSDKTEILKGTQPNVDDLYSGGVIPSVNDTPGIEHYKDIDGDWIINKKQRFINTKFTLYGDLFIKNGGSLTLENCILYMNIKLKNKNENINKKINNRIYVDESSSLNLIITRIIFNETGYWYKIVEGGNVEIDSNFEIYGKFKMQESLLENSLGINIYKGSNTHIQTSRILNCYHLSYKGKSNAEIKQCVISTFIGIPLYCRSCSPTVEDTILNVEYSGAGVYCFHSSPSIYNCSIFVCEDEDSDDHSFIIVDGSHPVLSNTIFNSERVRHDSTSSIVFK